MGIRIYYGKGPKFIILRTQFGTNIGYHQVIEPEVNQMMEIEAMSVFDQQMDSWAWKVYVNGTKMVEQPNNRIVSSNKIVVNIGPSPAATITGLKYSLTEPSGKLSLFMCERTQ